MFQSARVGTSTRIFGKQSFIHNSDRAKKKKSDHSMTVKVRKRVQLHIYFSFYKRNLNYCLLRVL